MKWTKDTDDKVMEFFMRWYVRAMLFCLAIAVLGPLTIILWALLR